MAHPLEFGLDTFGDVTERPAGVDGAGELISHAQSIRDLVEQAVLADQVGLDFIGVGEHHRVDFAVSAPEVVLAAIAASRTPASLRFQRSERNTRRKPRFSASTPSWIPSATLRESVTYRVTRGRASTRPLMT